MPRTALNGAIIHCTENNIQFIQDFLYRKWETNLA